jgi:hypothetical protein
MAVPVYRKARFAPVYAAAVCLLTACAGSSAPTGPPADLPPAPTASVPTPTSTVTALGRPCQHPDANVRSALAQGLDDTVEVSRPALLETRSRLRGAPVFYLAGVASRESDRVGVAVWATSTPTLPGSWGPVDTTAQVVSHGPSVAGTAAALDRNLSDYNRVSSCSTLGF